MTLQFREHVEIENLANLSAELVASFQQALREGAEASPDPKRPRLYEVSWKGKCYYVDVLPSGQRLILLAVWDTDVSPAYLPVA
jgi:hypothetical protein